MSTAERIRHFSQAGIPVPAVKKTPENPILEKHYGERPSRGQPLSSNGINSASFQLNSYANSIESVEFPENVQTIQGNLFWGPERKFWTVRLV